METNKEEVVSNTLTREQAAEQLNQPAYPQPQDLIVSNLRDKAGCPRECRIAIARSGDNLYTVTHGDSIHRMDKVLKASEVLPWIIERVSRDHAEYNYP